MGWWSALKTFFATAATQVVGGIVAAVEMGALAVASVTFAILATAVIVLVVAVVLVKYYVEPEKVEEHFSNYAVTGEFVYHASIHQDNVHHCSGAFIGTYFILTVAHCVYNFVNDQTEISKLKVYVGMREVPTYFTCGYAVDKITVHPKFLARRLAYNIAVLKLTEKVTEPYFVDSVTLPSPKMNMEETTVLVSGFINLGAPLVKVNMTKCEMTIVEHNTCHSHFIKIIETAEKFCMIPSYSWKPCLTSRGGPAATADEILIGLFVMKDLYDYGTHLPEIFVDVAKFLDFIKDATK